MSYKKPKFKVEVPSSRMVGYESVKAHAIVSGDFFAVSFPYTASTDAAAKKGALQAAEAWLSKALAAVRVAS